MQSLIDGGADDEIFVDVDEGEPTALIFTSGTTALPKGVELTYLNLSVYVMNTMSPADPRRRTTRRWSRCRSPTSPA